MYELVELKKDEVFTTSKTIADGVGIKHHAVQQLIEKYESYISRFGSVAFEMRARKRDNGGGVSEKVYLLNEQQATYLMTLMRNDGDKGIVVDFKARLVEEFFRMRDFIREKQTEQYNYMRADNKSNRMKETDVIKRLAEYAKTQGSEHSEKLYMAYTKLAKTVISGDRETIGIAELSTLTLVENIILQTIRIDMSMDMGYKDIYKDCKERIEKFKDIAYLNKKEEIETRP